MSTISVPLPTALVMEIVMRSAGKSDPTVIIENLVIDFLERTRGDGHLWSEEHVVSVEEDDLDERANIYGSIAKGYHWQSVFLPNATKLRIEYKGNMYFAEVRHQQIYFNDKPCSPSQFASMVAENTSRNAWRDIWIKRPTDGAWCFSNQIRMEMEKRT